MFSVVIPLYNKEQSITNTLQSVLDQTFTDFEVVIVNDGSTDGSAKKVEAFNDPRIRLINQENAGVSAARNRGIKEAKFEWIAFLDADDLWYPEKLAKAAKEISDITNLQLVLHAFETVIVHKNKTILNKHQAHGVLPSLVHAIAQGLKIQTSAVVLKKDLFDKDAGLYFQEGVNNSEDREVWYKLACLKVKTAYISEPLSKYLIDKGVNSLTTSNRKRFHFLEMETYLSDYYQYLNSYEKKELQYFIKSFNQKAISNYWIKLNYFPADFECHLTKPKYKFYRTTIRLPKMLKKIISKIIKP